MEHEKKYRIYRIWAHIRRLNDTLGIVDVFWTSCGINFCLVSKGNACCCDFLFMNSSVKTFVIANESIDQ